MEILTLSPTRQAINRILDMYGLDTSVSIDIEAEEMILLALCDRYVDTIWISPEGEIIINYHDYEQATI